MRAVTNDGYGNLPVLPIMATGATDGIFFQAIGMPVYGVPGTFVEADMSGVHGLNERKSVSGLYAERDYLFELIQVYANAKDSK